MKRGVAGGFTIVETMIVLAVSSVLFISMVGLIQGQQAKVQFKNSMTDIVSDIQATIGQVSSGFYPSIGSNFKCESVPAVGGNVPQIRATWDPGKPGANDDCTLMGQAIMFGVCNINDTEKYTIQTLVGLRQTSAGKTPANFSEVRIRVMAPGASADTVLLPDEKHLPLGNVENSKLLQALKAPLGSASITTNFLNSFNRINMLASAAPAPEDNGCGGTNPVGGTPNYSETKPMGYGTTIKWMRYEDAVDDSIPIAGLAVVTSSGNQSSGAGGSESGTVQSNVVPIPCGIVPTCSSKGTDQAHGVDAITRTFEGTNVIIKGVKLCFSSAGTNQTSLVKVGNNGGENSIEMTIHNNLDCQ